MIEYKEKDYIITKCDKDIVSDFFMLYNLDPYKCVEYNSYSEMCRSIHPVIPLEGLVFSSTIVDNNITINILVGKDVSRYYMESNLRKFYKRIIRIGFTKLGTNASFLKHMGSHRYFGTTIVISKLLKKEKKTLK